MSDVKKMKIAELKKELSDKGLSTKGNKPELLERLQTFLDTSGEAGLGAADVEVAITGGEEEEEEEEEEVEDGDEILEEDDEEEIVAPAKELIEETKEVKEGEAESSPAATEDEGETKQPELQERNPVTAATHKIVKITPPTTDKERKKLRAERYSMPLKEGDKKAARAARFGGVVIPSSDSETKKSGGGTLVSSLDDRLKKRAERFGTNVAPVAIKADQNEKLLKRKQRFGGITSSAAVGSPDVEAKKKQRAERFGVA